MRRSSHPLLALLLGLALPLHAVANRPVEWTTRNGDGAVHVHLYFFWAKTCPHCERAQPFVESLPEQYPWIELHMLELSEDRDNVRRYISMAEAVGQQARSVPAFLFCGTMMTGYDSPSTTGALLLARLQDCRTAEHERGSATLPHREAPISVPLLGETDLETLSLPLLTVVLAGLDSLNPCAFFVLLFLLSLLVHARSRARMLAIGGIFVGFSGVVYFVFMATWLNVFLLLGQLSWVTLGAGALAMLLGLTNIRDYFWFQRGVTLSIPNGAKPRLYQRVRTLLNANSLITMAAAATVLALAANSYELLCTAGFPMVYTRILTLHQLATGQYYLYLAFYNALYVTPLLLIVGAFAATMGARRLAEREGRILKLLSGLMMLELGAVLLFAPKLLNSVLIAVILLGIALVMTALLVRCERHPH